MADDDDSDKSYQGKKALKCYRVEGTNIAIESKELESVKGGNVVIL